MSSIAFIAFTQRGCILAQKLAQGLPEQRSFAGWSCHVSGPARYADELGIAAYESLDEWVGAAFAQDDALVFVGATGIAVRAIAPYTKDKFSDPAVVSIDEAGAFAVSLLSGHVGGANELARALSAVAGGQAVVSTATDVNGVFAVDEWAERNGFAIVERELAKKVSATLLEGGTVGFASDIAWEGELPAGLIEGPAPLGICVSADTAAQPFPATLHVVPRTVVVGVGCRRGIEYPVLAQVVDDALEAAGVSWNEVATLATIDVKRDEEAIRKLAEAHRCDVRFYSAEELAQVPGEFASSAFVEQTVGVDNVCERAACADGARLFAPRHAEHGVTVALAKFHKKGQSLFMKLSETAPGALRVVGLGPGGGNDLSGRARQAIQASNLVVGYTVYIDLLRTDFPEKEFYTTPMRKEVERCRYALEQAAAGRSVAVVCSGDPGVYGMAGLVFELAQKYPSVPIEVIPGVSASNGGAAVLGAPLMHDHCLISLSDLLTPWELIERRLAAAAQADFVICLYNPSSHKRPDYLQRACDILLAHRSPDTVCGTVSNIGRAGQESRVLTLGELRDTSVDMFTTVFIGNSQTRAIAGRMVTPRGYLQRKG